MAYATSNPPRVAVPGVGGGQTIWTYSSADAVTSVVGTDYFSNGDDLGMKLGDVVLIYDSNTNDGGIAFVTAVTAGGAASAAEYQAVTT
jgi:hypothetical protein